MKYQILFFIVCIFLTNCSKKVNEHDLNRDAEQLAMDLCHTQWVETKIQQVEQKIIRLQDSLKLVLSDSLKADITFKLRKAKDGLEYYTEQKSGYVKNNLEEQNKYITGLYSDPKNYQLLKNKANELLSKMPSCVSKEY